MVVTFHLDCLLVRVNNRLSRTSVISNTADVLILSNVPVYIGPYRVAYVVCMHACVYCINLMFCLKYQWPWCPAYWPRCPLIIFKSQGQLALPSNCPNSRPGCLLQNVRLSTEEKITVVQASAMLDVSDKVCVVITYSSSSFSLEFSFSAFFGLVFLSLSCLFVLLLSTSIFCLLIFQCPLTSFIYTYKSRNGSQIVYVFIRAKVWKG